LGGGAKGDGRDHVAAARPGDGAAEDVAPSVCPSARACEAACTPAMDVGGDGRWRIAPGLALAWGILPARFSGTPERPLGRRGQGASYARPAP
jgi:hypothetical protein